MAALTVQEVDTDGLEATYAAADVAGDEFTPQSGFSYIIHVKNGGGSSINVVVNDPTSTSPTGATAFNPDVTVAVTNAEDRFIKVDQPRFADPVTGKIQWTYSSVTSVTVAVLSVRK